VARHLIEAGVSGIVIANRTLGRARELAQKFGAEAVLLAEIPEQLLDADIVITSTASQLPILGKGAVEAAVKARRHRPILMVDIAVPRDIEPQVGDLRDVYLYSVDDLREIVEQNMRSRHKEARKADQIIAEGVRLYMEDMRGLAAVDVVKDYRRMAEQMREMELQRALRALARGEDPQRIVTQLARGITNKLIHAPTTGLRQASADGRQDLLAHARKLLGLAAGHRPQPEDADSDDEKDFDLPAGDAEKPGHTLQ
jgi:glutamyl-tRNA reductase